jgi:hypothetical protein
LSNLVRFRKLIIPTVTFPMPTSAHVAVASASEWLGKSLVRIVQHRASGGHVVVFVTFAILKKGGLGRWVACLSVDAAALFIANAVDVHPAQPCGGYSI